MTTSTSSTSTRRSCNLTTVLWRDASTGDIVNTFAGGPFDRFLPKDLSAAYADIDPDMDKVQPVLDFILTVHADDDQPTFEYIMNWLTKMVGRREKM